MAGRKQTATMELAIGATIIAAVIMLIVMLMAWGNSTSFLGRHYRVVVNMVNVGGLKEGAPVKMGGFQIGRVASIQIRQGATDMEIILDIDENRLLPQGSTAKVSTAGLVGDAFMEIIPGKSADTIRRAANVADAERLESSPLPDMQEMLTKVGDIGDQAILLIANLNDIVGDVEFRKNVKSVAANIDSLSYQANLVLQRSQTMLDNFEIASKNIATISTTAMDSVEKITDNIEDITDRVRDIADQAKGMVDNLDGGITDARRAISQTVGDPDFVSDLKQTMKNANTISKNISDQNKAIAQISENLAVLSEDLRKVAIRVREITDKVEPAVISNGLNSLSAAIASMTEVVDKIKAEPVLALSVNKAADRIVKMKFDEMSKQPQFRTSDAVLDEINRWVHDAMRRGYAVDPAYSHDRRPYVMGK